ncbi:hypothetical protein Tco_1356344 [Tanacetum coccineum]
MLPLQNDSPTMSFAGELITMPTRIINREHEEYISLMERLLYDNSSPRSPEDFLANPNTIIESLPTFPIPLRIVTLEKSPHLLSRWAFNPSKIISDFSKSPMMISGGDIPILDVSRILLDRDQAFPTYSPRER